MTPDGPDLRLHRPEPGQTAPDGAVSRHAGPADARVRARIQQSSRLSFADFMAEGLYGPEGYYTRRARLGGRTADFFTSPELHPAFGALLGQFAANVWAQLGSPDRFDLVEHGPGTGVLCRDLLTWADHAVPTFGQAIRYRLVEASPVLRDMQRGTLAAAGLNDGRISWSSAADQGTSQPEPSRPGERVTGLVLANELVDALPVHIVAMRQGRLRERFVVLDEAGHLSWSEDEPSTDELPAYFERLGTWPGEGCLAEVNLAAVRWMERAAAMLERGALLVLDYGYPAPELYAPQRRHGTLLTYRAHTLGSDPLVNVGAQDITAHVDFTSLARAGERSGLTTVGLISQAALLQRLGLGHYLRELERATLRAAEYEANRRGLQALVDPDGLGKVQALLQTRELPAFDPFERPADLIAPDAARTWLPLLRPDQMRLPGPLEAEGFLDLEAQWAELFDQSDAAATDSELNADIE